MYSPFIAVPTTDTALPALRVLVTAVVIWAKIKASGFVAVIIPRIKEDVNLAR